MAGERLDSPLGAGREAADALAESRGLASLELQQLCDPRKLPRERLIVLTLRFGKRKLSETLAPPFGLDFNTVDNKQYA